MKKPRQRTKHGDQRQMAARNTGYELPKSRQRTSWRNGFMRSSEPRKCSPPFNMVIIDKRGTVVFECNVSREGKVRPFGLVRRVQHSHFPATALLTDRSQVTRTFLIEYAASSNGSN